MAGLTDVLRGQLSDELIPQLQAAMDDITYQESLETVSAPGALSPIHRTTILEVDGTDAFTLADPPSTTKVGTLKTITCTVAANTPIGTLTPVTFISTSILFNAVAESATLMWLGSVLGWAVYALNGATVT